MAAEGPDGIYKVTRVSGATYVEGERFEFPPQAILAAAVGRRIVVENERIQMNEHAKGEISRAIVRDPRLLGKVVSFRLGALPRFERFKEAADGVLRAETRSPFIIGLTANAMQGDREMCLGAGMNHYIPKPIRVVELVDALLKARRVS